MASTIVRSEAAARQFRGKTEVFTGARDNLEATFYLSSEALDSLERAHYQLRQWARPADRGKISKSLIVEAAIRIAVEELEAKAGRSRLAGMLANRTANRARKARPGVVARSGRAG